MWPFGFPCLGTGAGISKSILSIQAADASQALLGLNQGRLASPESTAY